MKKIMILAVAALCSVCCSKNITDECRISIAAEGPDAAKAELSTTNKARWNAGDLFSVFYKNGTNLQWRYTGENKTTSGTITYSGRAIDGGNQSVVAIYPFFPNVSRSGDNFTVKLPECQYVKKSYDIPALLAAEQSGTDPLKFKYAQAMVGLVMRGDAKVVSITVRGGNSEVLCGDANLVFNNGTPVLTMAPSASGVSVTVCKEGGSSFSACTAVSDSRFFAAVPAGKYEKGFEIEVNYTTGPAQLIRYTDAVTLKAGDLMLIKAWTEQKYDVTLDFMDGPEAFGATYGQIINCEGPDETSYDLTVDGKQYTFAFCPTSEKKAEIVMGSETFGYMLRLRSTNGYLKIPAVKGYSLSSVTYIQGKDGVGTDSYTFITSNPFNEDGVPLASAGKGNIVSNEVHPEADGIAYTYNIGGAEENTAYYLQIGKGSYFTAYSITFTYKKCY